MLETLFQIILPLATPTVNMTAAILGANANGDGWFDLELRGTYVHVQDALNSLQEMNLEVWKEKLS
ncbi:MAG: NIL domain-containing protein [Leptolyngbyaceae cyanobacterium HOT.MB2.61]|jgi:hypothetical protein|nr:NIL domain-containing protein [Leptolyngbyaceae cyanobacterium HOT.MB2.61]